MNILKKILIALIIILVTPLVIALFIPKEYTVVREITIDRPSSEVFEYVKYLKNQDNYSKWVSMDPDMKKTFRGTDGTVGFVSAWESTNETVGVGEQEILSVTEGERIDYELRFFEPFEDKGLAYTATSAIGEGQTKVTWGYDGKMEYPINLLLLFMDFDEMIGNDFDYGLQKLKVILETTSTTDDEAIEVNESLEEDVD